MAGEARFCHLSGGKNAPRSPDEVIGEIAAGQHGVVARAQLLAAGVGRRAIDGRVSRGALYPLHRGVFAVGHRRVSRDGWWMAATLAGADGAVLSHRSAAALWRMRDTTRRAEVTVVRHRGPRPGVQFHQAVLKSDEIAVVEGIPVTTPARTLLDLATVLTDQHLEAAFQEAEVRRLTSPTSLDALLERYPGRRGTAALRRILEHHRKIAHPIPTSVLERRFLIVECEGFATHATRQAFEPGRAKDRQLVVAGWRAPRLTWRQLTDDADTIARQLAALLND